VDPRGCNDAAVLSFVLVLVHSMSWWFSTDDPTVSLPLGPREDDIFKVVVVVVFVLFLWLLFQGGDGGGGSYNDIEDPCGWRLETRPWRSNAFFPVKNNNRKQHRRRFVRVPVPSVLLPRRSVLPMYLYTPRKYTHTYVLPFPLGKSRVTSRDATSTPEIFGIAVVVRWFISCTLNHHVQKPPHTTSQISQKKPFLGGQQEDGG
jgi:hypothetical protein